MNRRIAACVGAAWAFLSSAGAGVCRSQLSADFTVASFQFNISNPGARSLGMGGAFAGLADDATAAYANPAGLTILTRPEVSFEGRDSSFTAPLIDSRVFLLTHSSPELGPVFVASFDETPLGVPDLGGTSSSFVSLVYPHKRWTLALYRHQLADLHGRAASSEVESSSTREFEFTTSRRRSAALELDIIGTGLAAGFRVNDRLSLGAALVSYEASIGLIGRRVTERETRSLLEAREPLVLTSSSETSLMSDERTTAVNLGLLLRVGRRWSAGVFFREGPSFSVLTERSGATQPFLEVTPGLAPFSVPDVAGVGLAWRPTARMLVMGEWDRVGYSSLVRGTHESGTFKVDDADELRIGLEYSWWSLRVAPAVRVGAWVDPDHKVRFESFFECPGLEIRTATGLRCETFGTGAIAALAVPGAALASLFQAGEDDTHLTAGFGLVPRPGLQVDAAVDYVSSDRYTVSLSGVVRF